MQLEMRLSNRTAAAFVRALQGGADCELLRRAQLADAGYAGAIWDSFVVKLSVDAFLLDDADNIAAAALASVLNAVDVG